MTQDLPKHVRGKPNVHKLTAMKKIEGAHTVEEAMTWFSKEEKMMMLSDISIFNALTAVEHSQLNVS
jgi:hypothetical protein